MKTKNEGLTVQLDEKILSELDRYCLERNLDRSEAVNGLLTDALDRKKTRPSDPNQITEWNHYVDARIAEAKEKGLRQVTISLPQGSPNCSDQLWADHNRIDMKAERKSQKMIISW